MQLRDTLLERGVAEGVDSVKHLCVAITRDSTNVTEKNRRGEGNSYLWRRKMDTDKNGTRDTKKVYKTKSQDVLMARLKKMTNRE